MYALSGISTSSSTGSSSRCSHKLPVLTASVTVDDDSVVLLSLVDDGKCTFKKEEWMEAWMDGSTVQTAATSVLA